MMRQRKIQKKIQKSTGVNQKVFPILCVVLCLLALLTGCEEADKALVFSAESLTESYVEDLTEDTESARTESETGYQVGENAPTICVHVCGAVMQPGVVEVQSGSRAWDALEAAGGFSPDADSEYVNLASSVEDGQQLYFPTAEEAERWRADMTVLRSGQILVGNASGLININTADEALLCTLPGIGQAKAQAIIAYRKQKGLFERPEDIMKVAGIKQSAFDKISTQIVVE